MKTYSTLSQRLKNYAAMGATIAPVAASAQIVYTDVTPDQVLTIGQTFNIDMDGVAPHEFMVRQGSNTTFFTSAIYNSLHLNGSASSPEVIAYSWTGLSGYFSANIMSTFSAGVLIGSSQSFFAGTLAAGGYGFFSLSGYMTTFGQPMNASFVGVRFNISGNTHYGWIRLSASSPAGTITVHDFAYNSLANQPITTGQGVGIEDYLGTQLIINSDHGEVQIAFGELLGEKTVELVDLTGSVVLAEQATGGNGTWDVSDLAAGVYLVRVSHNGATHSQKIYIR